MRVHPSDELHAGDWISFELYISSSFDGKDKKISARLASAGVQALGEARLEWIASNQWHASLTWAWDTRAAAPGEQRVEFSILPGGPTWQESFVLLPALAEAPTWETTESECCHIHTITGTTGAKKIDEIKTLADRAWSLARQRLGSQSTPKIDLNLIEAVIGHGGFAGDEIVVTVSEQSYLPIDFQQVLLHEFIHRIDAQLSKEARPIMLVEGLAVYLAGGHYRVEPLGMRAALLQEPGWYIPLPMLAGDFYGWQHEIGYLEAGALVEFLVGRWGWDEFLRFYRSITPSSKGEVDAIDRAVQANFGFNLAELDVKFADYLAKFPHFPDLAIDLETLVSLFDSIRQYQRQYEPGAYYREAWLPDAAQMRKKEIVADFLLAKGSSEAGRIREMLIEAGKNWQIGDDRAADQILVQIRAQLHQVLTIPIDQTSLWQGILIRQN